MYLQKSTNITQAQHLTDTDFPIALHCGLRHVFFLICSSKKVFLCFVFVQKGESRISRVSPPFPYCALLFRILKVSFLEQHIGLLLNSIGENILIA